jgi:hypothetical protein
MKYVRNNPQVQPEQEPMEPATPTPAPEVAPKRRRFIQPTFSARTPVRPGRPARLAMTTALTLFALGTYAQSDTLQRDTQTTPRGQQPGTSTQQGWVMFNDQMGRELNIPADQMQRLREVDERYAAEYRALGADPTKNPGYRALTERRTNDIHGIVSGDTYGRWEKRYGGSMMNDRTNRTNPEKGTKAGSDTDTPKKKTTTTP